MLADDSGMLTTHIINWRVLRIKIGYLPFATCATLPPVVVDVDLLKHIFMDGGSMDDGWTESIIVMAFLSTD